MADTFRNMEVSWDENRPTGQGLMGTTIRSGEPQVVKDVFADHSLSPWREHYRKLGLVSKICLPLVVQDASLGGLVILSKVSEAFDDEEVALWRQLADDVSYGIVSIRNQLARKKAEKIYEKRRTLAASGGRSGPGPVGAGSDNTSALV